MADQKLTQLAPVPDPVVDSDLVYLVRGTDSYQATIAQVHASITPGAAVWGDITGTLPNQTDLNTALGLKAPLASPALTGTPTSPTAAPGTNTTQLATTAFVLANGGTGTVTSVSSANGDLTVATGTTTPLLTVISAPKLTTARNINGVSFDGTGNITVTVAISTGVTGLGTGVATFLATPSSANLAAAVTDETGSGALVFATSPTLVTPALGTPASGVLTNVTGLPIATGVSGLGANVAAFLATPSSANLAAALTDETGSGAAVFATSPTLVTPALGTPASGVLTNTTGLPISTGVSGLGSNVATFLATPTSANLAAALTNETGTGVVVFSDSPAFTTGMTLDGVILAPQIQQNIQNGAYTMVLSDANKEIQANSGTAQTWTIPANSSVAFPIGTTLMFYVNGAIGPRTIAITTDTMNWAPNGTTGSRTLQGGGIATAYKAAATTWVLTGVGIT